jgi:hypothetical protein
MLLVAILSDAADLIQSEDQSEASRDCEGGYDHGFE